MFFGWLRVETGSIASPFLIHALFNSMSAAAALVALRRPALAS
jgi:membrane protease YdiL (CAAX protease family)